MSGEEDRAEGHEGFVAREREQRLAKLDELRKRGIDPYPPRYDRDHTAAEIHQAHGDLGSGEETKDEVRVAGRAMHIRRHGGLIFCDLRDESGRIQLLVSGPTPSATSATSTAATGSAPRGL